MPAAEARTCLVAARLQRLVGLARIPGTVRIFLDALPGASAPHRARNVAIFVRWMPRRTCRAPACLCFLAAPSTRRVPVRYRSVPVLGSFSLGFETGPTWFDPL